MTTIIERDALPHDFNILTVDALHSIIDSTLQYEFEDYEMSVIDLKGGSPADPEFADEKAFQDHPINASALVIKGMFINRRTKQIVMAV